MAKNITFNSYDIQSATIISEKIQHSDFGNRAISRRRKTRSDGFDIYENYFSERIIVVRGIVKGTSQANLDANLDTLKENLVGEEKNLDIDYGSGSVRRYIATVQSLELPEEYFNVTFIPFIVTFVCQPFGRDNVSTNHSADAIITSPYSGSVNIAGTASAKPVITITISNETNATALVFNNTTTGESITITRSFADLDVITIDCDLQRVRVNNVDVAFTGVFPSFPINTNNYQITFTDTGGFNINLDIDYTAKYL